MGKANTITFGQRIKFNCFLKRVVAYENNQRIKKWILIPRTELLGIVIGKRTLKNGTANFSGDFFRFEASETFVAYVVAYSLNKKSVFVPASGITVVKTIREDNPKPSTVT